MAHGTQHQPYGGRAAGPAPFHPIVSSSGSRVSIGSANSVIGVEPTTLSRAMVPAGVPSFGNTTVLNWALLPYS